MAQVGITVNQPYYHPGDVVQGIVHLELPKKQHVRSIVLQAQGFERTRISETHGTGKHRHTHTYISNNFMHSFNVGLLGECEVPPGSYDYPFEYQLPPVLLPSYRGCHVSVAYLINVNVDIPFWFDPNTSVETPVAIPRGNVAIEKVPVTFASQGCQDTSRPGFMVTLARTMFLAGEAIKGNFMLTGDGGKTIRKADIMLQLVEYAVAQGHSRTIYQDLVRSEIPGTYLRPGATVPFELPIPISVPSAYNGVYSQIGFRLFLNLDVAWAFDTAAAQGLVIINTQ